jgi:nitrite reductase/ring-hydroxylating ferredoxin subunit
MADAKIGAASGILAGRGRTVDVGGKSIAVFNIGGNFHAIDNACTHVGGSLGNGSLDGTTVTCPWHGAQFDVTTGEVKGPPARRGVKTYPVKVDGEDLVVSL